MVLQEPEGLLFHRPVATGGQQGLQKTQASCQGRSGCRFRQPSVEQQGPLVVAAHEGAVGFFQARGAARERRRQPQEGDQPEGREQG